MIRLFFCFANTIYDFLLFMQSFITMQEILRAMGNFEVIIFYFFGIFMMRNFKGRRIQQLLKKLKPNHAYYLLSIVWTKIWDFCNTG